jgi:cytochrome c oxidase assembly factor CtaG
MCHQDIRWASGCQKSMTHFLMFDRPTHSQINNSCLKICPWQNTHLSQSVSLVLWAVAFRHDTHHVANTGELLYTQCFFKHCISILFRVGRLSPPAQGKYTTIKTLFCMFGGKWIVYYRSAPCIGASFGCSVYIIVPRYTFFNSLLLLPLSSHPLMKHTIG